MASKLPSNLHYIPFQATLQWGNNHIFHYNQQIEGQNWLHFFQAIRVISSRCDYCFPSELYRRFCDSTGLENTASGLAMEYPLMRHPMVSPRSFKSSIGLFPWTFLYRYESNVTCWTYLELHSSTKASRAPLLE